MSNLNSRINSYKEMCDYKLLGRVPLVISINGRAFSKVTSLLDKPYCSKFGECILSTMLKICTEIDGAVFAYQHNDEIVVIVRNDQNNDTVPWCDNKIQKITSSVSSIATFHFNKCANAIDLNLLGEPIFISQIFAVPNVMEAINTMVHKQQQNFHTSIQSACLYEFLKKYDKATILNMLSGLSVDEKIDLLNQECNIDFNQYPIIFRRGAACYKVPKVMSDGTMKNKWAVNHDLPVFAKDLSFLTNILKFGADVFRG